MLCHPLVSQPPGEEMKDNFWGICRNVGIGVGLYSCGNVVSSRSGLNEQVLCVEFLPPPQIPEDSQHKQHTVHAMTRLEQPASALT